MRALAGYVSVALVGNGAMANIDATVGESTAKNVAASYCETKGHPMSDSPPIVFHQQSDGRVFTLKVGRKKPQSIEHLSATEAQESVSESSSSMSVDRLYLSEDVLDYICREIGPVHVLAHSATLAINETEQASNVHHKSNVLPVASSVPTSFTITYYFIPSLGWTVLGSFWVPNGPLPAGATTQYSYFDLKTTGFTNSGNQTHFAHSMLTYAPNNVFGSNGFSGNGMILGALSAFASCTGGNRYMSLIEAWRLNPYSNYVYINNTPGSPNPPAIENAAGPNTCFPHTDGVKRTYGLQANYNRYIYYGVWPNGLNSTPLYVSPSIQTPSVPTFVTGYSGLAYLVAGPLTQTTPYKLEFTNVGHGSF
jgi:hypothetical protein